MEILLYMFTAYCTKYFNKICQCNKIARYEHNNMTEKIIVGKI